MARGKNYKSEEHRLREKMHQFGQPNANPRGDQSVAGRQRAFYLWCETMATLDELKEYANDATKPAARRKFVQALMTCEKVQDFFDLTNQTHGQPKQVIEVQDLPAINCNVFGDDESL